MLTACLVNIVAFAQDTATTVTNTTSTATSEKLWYMQPWVWVVGGVALLLILIALLSGGKSKSKTDRVVITKTVRTDSDTQ